MSETKREWLPLYSFYDRSGVAHHLEEMAAEGWMLESLGTYSWRYRRMEPKSFISLSHISQQPPSLTLTPLWIRKLFGIFAPQPDGNWQPARHRFRFFTMSRRIRFPLKPTPHQNITISSDP